MKTKNTKPTVQDIFPDIKPQNKQNKQNKQSKQSKPQKKDYCTPSPFGKQFVQVDRKAYCDALEKYIKENEVAINMHYELVEQLKLMLNHFGHATLNEHSAELVQNTIRAIKQAEQK